MQTNSFNVDSFNIVIRNKLNPTITITSSKLQNKTKFANFLIIVKFFFKLLENEIDFSLSIFQQVDCSRKMIRLIDLNNLVQNKSKFLSIINFENNLIYFQSSIEKKDLKEVTTFIGIEIRVKNRLSQEYLNDNIKIRLLQETGLLNLNNFFLNERGDEK